ncbi:MAG: Ig-like domain-containing protein [Gemmatimonadaceae bacterium]
MHKVSRSLLLAGVLAFGGLTAACDNGTTTVVGNPGVQSITLTPPSASVAVGSTIQLAVSVVADANTAKTVNYTTSSASIATVDATGKVTGIAVGTATIIATSTADATKAAASVVTVTGPTTPGNPNPSIAINSVTDVNGNPVTLGNVNGQINVTVNTSGGGLIEVFLSTSCTTNTIGATDVAVASQQATSAQAGTVTLSFNTAQLTAANQARFANGNYCIKTRLTNGASVVVATNTVPLTLNNANVFNGTIAFATVTGGPTSAVSSNNGLNYNQGTLTATLNPVIFTGSSPAVFISGYLTRNGAQGAVFPAGAGNAAFTNAAVTNGVATIVFTDTATFPSFAGSRSIAQYTSLPAGDTLYVTSATDAAGNPISVGAQPFAIASARGVRIDNDIPNDAATTYIVQAPNGYIGAAYSFASGTGGTAPADNRGGVQGVGGVTTTYYVGATGSAAFATANSCTTTGLTAATVGTDLANTQTNTAVAAKVVIKDALGNQICHDVSVNTLLGVVTVFGVDKIAPNLSMTTANNGAAANTGYNVAKNFSFIYNDTISGFGTAGSPLKGTLTKNFFAAGTSAAGDCVIGTYSVAAKTCSAVTITPTTSAGTPPNVANSIDMTNGSLIPGYYMVTATVTDLAANVSNSVTRLAAYDNVAPVIAGLTQSPAPVAAMATVTVTGNATDNLDLSTSKGNLTYATAPLPFQGVAGTSFGPNFDATLATTGAASVALPNVYRGLQSAGAGGAIQANAAVPVASLTVTDVGTNTSAAATLTIATATAATNVLQNTNTLTATPTSGAPATSQASTTLTINVDGLVSDASFQNQPFTQIDIYKVTSGELVLVGTATNPSNTTSGGPPPTIRTYTYTASGVALTAAATNTFYVIGRTAAGDGVISQAITVVNP